MQTTKCRVRNAQRHLETSREHLTVSCRHQEASGKQLMAYARHLETSVGIWRPLQASVKHLEPSGQHLRSILEASTLGFPP